MLAQSITEAHEALAEFIANRSNLERLETVAQALAGVITSGGKILAVGNGGSCCDAMHFSEELTGRFRDDRAPMPAIACSDPGHITCVANAYGYDEVFARWVTGLGNQGDALIALSTSGNSVNIVKAVEAAKTRGMTVVLLLGKDGGKLGDKGDHRWIAPGRTADRIQEIHMLILHTLIEGIEREVCR